MKEMNGFRILTINKYTFMSKENKEISFSLLVILFLHMYLFKFSPISNEENVYESDYFHSIFYLFSCFYINISSFASINKS